MKKTLLTLLLIQSFTQIAAQTIIFEDGFEDAEQVATFYTPQPIAQALQQSNEVVWSLIAQAPSDLLRFTLGVQGETIAVVLTDSSSSIDQELSLDADLTVDTSRTNDRLLRSMFKFIDHGSSLYRIVSTKHSNYALDINGSDALIIRDIRSTNIDVNSAAYLLFELAENNGGYVFTASARMIYDDTIDAFVNDPTWATKSLLVTGNQISLSNSTNTVMTLYSPPLDFDMPFDFNPEATVRVDNQEVPPEAKLNNPVANTPNIIVAEYSSQVTAIGSDSSTTAAATLMLANIKTSLESQGSSMRYPAEFYLAFREGLFSRINQSSDSTDGDLGIHTVPYVFFTNETDTNGDYHPFMVIASYGIPDSLSLLWDVARPPGDGNGGNYAQQNVTRSYHTEGFLMKIPIRDYGEVSSLTENIMDNDLASDAPGSVAFDHHNYASVSATGVAIDGVVIYPSYSNTLQFSQSSAELSAHGMHSGRGLGVHYHADAHSATHEELNLYNNQDYTDQSHPPMVSIGFDGVAGYGVYETGDTSSEGINIALDNFGGHQHGIYAYHYHSYTKSATTDMGGVGYTVHVLPPQGAWSGRINDIPEFWKNNSPDYVGGPSIYLGTQ